MLNRGVKLDLVSADPDKYAVDESVSRLSRCCTERRCAPLCIPAGSRRLVSSAEEQSDVYSAFLCHTDRGDC